MKVVIDTSFFSNSGSYKLFGNNPSAALKSFLSSNKALEVYMPPACWKELEGFLDFNTIPKDLLLTITIKAPNRSAIDIPSSIMYDLVCDFRGRSEAALKFATSLMRETYKKTPEKTEKGKPDPDTSYVKRMREGVRHHTREGFLDSGADLDVILLAKELNAKILTSDEGLCKWADKFGVERVPYRLFK